MSPVTAKQIPTEARSVTEHLAAVLDGIQPLGDENIPVSEALGAVLSCDVIAKVSLPPFDNSAMDGYAVKLADVTAASSDKPVILPVIDDIPAGSAATVALAPHSAIRIMTGAPIPEGTEAVVQVEWTDGGVREVQIHRSPAVGANIRRCGEDITAGATILTAGTTITPAIVGLLHGNGHVDIPVHHRPLVVVISTGAELAEPGKPLVDGQIYDANGPMLTAAAGRLGAKTVLAPIVDDVPGALHAALEPWLDKADLIVTSAGVSEGAYDVVKHDLQGMGTMTFARVAMQPGRPQGSGRLGPRQVPIVTLPGNPVSAYVSFHVFVRPVIARLMGQNGACPSVSATLTKAVTSPAGRAQYLRARLANAEGNLTVTPVGGPGSHLLGALAHSNALIVIPENATMMPAGTLVETLYPEGNQP